MTEEIYKTYLHNPPHLFRPNAVYIVTGSTYRKLHYLGTDEKKSQFCTTLFERSAMFGWELEAWAVLSNHYHFVAQAPEEATSLKALIQALHSISAIFINKTDRTPGRKIWHNYWDTCITHETSYLARLLYVHTNPIKHGIVERPEDYPFCSYCWFMEAAEQDFIDKVLAQLIDHVHVKDDF